MNTTAKTIVITGATNGIGFCAAQTLANLGHRVILHGRNEAKGSEALARIRGQNPAAQVEFFCADFASLAQVRGLAERINQLPQLHMLITTQEPCLLSAAKLKTAMRPLLLLIT